MNKNITQYQLDDMVNRYGPIKVYRAIKAMIARHQVSTLLQNYIKNAGKTGRG
jgi:hypothetical protein